MRIKRLPFYSFLLQSFFLLLRYNQAYPYPLQQSTPPPQKKKAPIKHYSVQTRRLKLNLYFCIILCRAHKVVCASGKFCKRGKIRVSIKTYLQCRFNTHHWCRGNKTHKVSNSDPVKEYLTVILSLSSHFISCLHLHRGQTSETGFVVKNIDVPCVGQHLHLVFNYIERLRISLNNSMIFQLKNNHVKQSTKYTNLTECLSLLLF